MIERDQQLLDELARVFLDAALDNLLRNLEEQPHDDEEFQAGGGQPVQQTSGQSTA